MNNMKEVLKQTKIINSCRGIYGDDLINAMKAIRDGGVKFIDVAYQQDMENGIAITTADIKKAKEFFGDSLNIGAGNVMNVEQVELAHSAGANYIVCPNLDDEVVKRTKELGMFSIPGGFTATEFQKAHKLGADMVMVYPTSCIPAGYLNMIIGKGPLSHIDLIACGGVNTNNLADFYKQGFSAAVIGQFLADKESIKKGDFAELTRRAKLLTEIAQNA